MVHQRTYRRSAASCTEAASFFGGRNRSIDKEDEAPPAAGVDVGATAEKIKKQDDYRTIRVHTATAPNAGDIS